MNVKKLNLIKKPLLRYNTFFLPAKTKNLNSTMTSVPDSIRLNKYKSLYIGKETKDPYLALRAKNDKVAYEMLLAPPHLGHFSSVQRSHPKNYDLNILRHQKPLFINPDERGASRFIRGSAQYNQAVLKKIAELGKIAGKVSY